MTLNPIEIDHVPSKKTMAFAVACKIWNASGCSCGKNLTLKNKQSNSVGLLVGLGVVYRSLRIFKQSPLLSLVNKLQPTFTPFVLSPPTFSKFYKHLKL